MDPKRQGEIAIMLVKYLINKQGIKLSHDNVREFEVVAKEIGVPFEEMKQFAKPFVQNLMDEIFVTK